MALGRFTGNVIGAGKHVVPSRPVEPESDSVLGWYYCKPQRQLTVYVRGMHRFSAERLCSSRMDWHVRPPDSGEDT